MPVDNTSVVNVNEKISPSRAKDTKISRDIFFLSFYRGICFIDIQNNIFFKRSSWRKSGKLNNYEHFCFFCSNTCTLHNSLGYLRRGVTTGGLK